MRKHLVAWAFALAGVVLLSPDAPAQARKGWGDIKGQVVFAPAKVPAPPNGNVVNLCAAPAAPKTNDLLVDPKTRGVKNVLVYLQDAKHSKKADFTPPIHPKLRKFATEVELTPPGCDFDPRVVALREGQQLVVNNTTAWAIGFKLDAGVKGPNVNLFLRAGGKATVKGLVAWALPVAFTSQIHPWMRGYVATFKHPYFAVTDKDGNFEIKNAPAGKFRLVFWHEKAGWVVLKGGARGVVVEIKAGKTTKIAPVKLTPLD